MYFYWELRFKVKYILMYILVENKMPTVPDGAEPSDK